MRLLAICTGLILSLSGLQASAGDRTDHCRSAAVSEACHALLNDCDHDENLGLEERRYCATLDRLKLPTLSLPPEDFILGVAARYLGVGAGPFDYSGTIQFTQGGVEYAGDSGRAFGPGLTMEIGFLDDFFIDGQFKFVWGKWWNHRLWTAAYLGAGWSYIGDGVLPSAGYLPVGFEAMFATSATMAVLLRSQIDLPVLASADVRRSHDSHLGVGTELRSDAGFVIGGFLDLLATHRQFMGRDWFGMTIGVRTGPNAPYQQSNTRRCVADDDCVSGEFCHPETHVCSDTALPKASAVSDCAERGRCSPLGGDQYRTRYVAVHPRSCIESNGCRQSGRCSLESGQCVVKNKSDCQRALDCKSNGFCSFQNGSCVNEAGTAKVESEGEPGPCGAQAACRMLGLCLDHDPFLDPFGYHNEPSCKARSDRFCQRSVACQVRGDCGLIGRVHWKQDPDVFTYCGPTTNAHCAQSSWCKVFGRCRLKAGVCSGERSK